MVGPHSPNHAVGLDGSAYTEAAGRQHLRNEAIYRPAHHAAPPPGAYPGFMPLPVSYPKQQRRRVIIGVLVVLAVVAAITATIALGTRSGPSASHTMSDASAKVAIQGYLNALEHRDVEGIVRNALCGLYDAVRDRRSDEALAKLSSDAFRKQFSQSEVTSIDKIVQLSQYQAQVLFTMQVVPATGGPPRDHVQGIAQLLLQRNQVLVCSYVLRTAGAY